MVRKIALYFIFVLLFVIGKGLFMCYHADIYSAYSIADCLSALLHGIPHDLTCAGYVTAIPFVLELFRIWIPGKWHTWVMRIYLPIIVFLILFNYFGDLVLYGSWGFRVDSTVMIYLMDDPIGAFSQGEVWQLILFPTLTFVLTWFLTKLLLKVVPGKEKEEDWRPTFFALLGRTGICLLLCALVFIAIRGGITTSTMNVGRVYFSSEMPLNQAATNPLFSFYSTLGKQKRFDKQYRFMSDDEAKKACDEMNTVEKLSFSFDSLFFSYSPDGNLAIDPTHVFTVNGRFTVNSEGRLTPDTLLKTQRPNIVLLILESFSGAACRSISAQADSVILPNVDRMYREGIGFTNMFANSFRTDRGVAAIMASYPGQPTNSVMKDQKRCNNLNYMSQKLRGEGYHLSFVHGGDVDFTNMRGFLTAAGFEDITGDTDFPISDRLSKWGVPDHLMFNHLYNEIVSEQADSIYNGQNPFFKVMLTLSSHEPFDVDYHHFNDPYVNSVAYADSCLGSFVDKLKQTALWENLLIIGIADHAFSRYPSDVQNHEVLRYRIPMFWTGGAVRKPCLVETYGSQTDLAATLLYQMGIGYDEFNFSKNMIDPASGHYAFYAFSDGFGFVTDSCIYIQDNKNDGCALSGSNDLNGTAEKWGKAYLQTLYDDLSRR